MAKKRKVIRKEEVGDSKTVYREIRNKFIQIVVFLLIVFLLVLTIKFFLVKEMTGNIIRDSSETPLPEDLTVNFVGLTENHPIYKSVNDSLQIEFAVGSVEAEKVSISVDYYNPVTHSYSNLCKIENFNLTQSVPSQGGSNIIYYKLISGGTSARYFYNCSWSHAVADVDYSATINVFNNDSTSYGYQVLNRVLSLSQVSNCWVNSPTSTLYRRYDDSVVVNFGYDSSSSALTNYVANITRSNLNGALDVRLCNSSGSLNASGQMAFNCSWNSNVANIENGTYDVSILLLNGSFGRIIGSCRQNQIVDLHGTPHTTPIPVVTNYTCGDGICSSSESSSSCPQDCIPAETCGDDNCDSGEDNCNCASDCPGTCEVNPCGDGTCDSADGEECGTTNDAPECNKDCGTCAEDKTWMIYFIIGVGVIVLIMVFILFFTMFKKNNPYDYKISSGGRPIPPRGPPTAPGGIARPMNVPPRNPVLGNPNIPRSTVPTRR